MASAPITDAPVLLTGLTGYIGSRLAVQLLNRGYAVRGTARNAQKAERVREAIAQEAPTERLTIVEAELLDSDSWHRAASGAEMVMHVASPLAAAIPDDPDDLIVPAREGTLNVLRAATAAGARRVVLTSSMAAIVYGLTESPEAPMTEERWSHPEGSNDHVPYTLSKYYAEQAAWDYVRSTPGAPELVTVNPGAVLGPLLTTNASESTLIVSKMMKGELPGIPKIGFEVVDVRDVADLHIRAMETPEASGERFLAVAGYRTLSDVAAIIGREAPDYAKKLPRMEIPNWVVRILGRFDAETRGIVFELGKRRTASSGKAREHLGWAPRSPEEAIAATARDVVRLGLV